MSDQLFKAGDKVKCIDGNAGSLITDEFYTISRGQRDQYDSYVDVFDKTGYLYQGWFASRFEKVEENKMLNWSDIKVGRFYSSDPGRIEKVLAIGPDYIATVEYIKRTGLRYNTTSDYHGEVWKRERFLEIFTHEFTPPTVTKWVNIPQTASFFNSYHDAVKEQPSDTIVTACVEVPSGSWK